MDLHSDVAVLLDLVPADFAGRERIDWGAAETELGIGLPSDYGALLDTYGVGDIGDLVILPPLPSDVRGRESAIRARWRGPGGVPPGGASDLKVVLWVEPVALLGGRGGLSDSASDLAGAVSCSCGRFSVTARWDGSPDVGDTRARVHAPGRRHRPKTVSTLAITVLMSLV
ncbi:hypothetical protein [Streptomyces sp. NPDC050388]|uniref:hypothetical protein n=1 Tax=Streptomyces sp. NPDC050388 TaxID=3155781 RepID=UPI0034416B8F